MQNAKVNNSFNSQSRAHLEVLITLALGAIIGFLTLAFIKSLAAIEAAHISLNQSVPYHLLLIPIVLIAIELIKKNTLYFPSRTAHLPDEKTSQHWSVFMTPLHFFGTCISHLSGVSVGRESAVVLYSAGVVRLLKLPWIFWGPIVGAIAFSAVVGQFWVAPFFLFELFGRTNIFQKIYSFMGAWLAVLIIKSFGEPPLLSASEITIDMGFFEKLFFLFFFAACAGYLMRLYKNIYFRFSTYFLRRPLWIKAAVALILAYILYLPAFRKYQSMGLSQFADFSIITSSFFDVLVKLFLTIISVTLGFFGGEFIPLIYSGVYFGHSFFAFFGHSTLLGAALGAYLLFTGATRFKWTSYILILSLMGSSWWFWAYFLVLVTVVFSGPLSIYRKPELA